ncbi:MAG: metallophosphoesterase [Candidatus Heimdallarchaeota archaeon]|nr:MAG: metallophosphoesterase [Candidatus Heimdallarchaeota archaeon]
MNETELIRIFLEKNFNIAAEALDYLLEKNISENVLREIINKIPQDIPVINRALLETYLGSLKQPLQAPIDESIEIIKKHEQPVEEQKFKTDEIIQEQSVIQPPLLTDRPLSQIRIKRDIPERTSDEPDIASFRRLFKNRFEQLSAILKENITSSDTVLKRTLIENEIPHDRRGILIGMVQDTRVLHTNKFVIHLEDPETETTTNCVMVQDSVGFPEYRNILRDSVIGISGVLPKNFEGGDITAFWGTDIIRPSFERIKFKPTNTSKKVLFIADIHFGSKYFSRRVFAKLIDFLNLKGLNTHTKETAAQISTVIIAGDLVEGVGRFSNQKSTITQSSYQTQYENLGNLLGKIPSEIQIIVIPGEHDATQTALPQPAIDRQIGEALYTIPNLKSYGNPLRCSIDNINFLIFHGQGNDTLFQTTKQIHINPIEGIQHLLEYRHLCPEYGSFNPLAPFKRDYLVVEKIPDVVVTGHFHQTHFKEYKGVKIITCGTFQRANSEQIVKDGISFGIVPVLDTKTGTAEMIDLKRI